MPFAVKTDTLIANFTFVQYIIAQLTLNESSSTMILILKSSPYLKGKEQSPSSSVPHVPSFLWLVTILFWLSPKWNLASNTNATSSGSDSAPVWRKIENLKSMRDSWVKHIEIQYDSLFKSSIELLKTCKKHERKMRRRKKWDMEGVKLRTRMAWPEWPDHYVTSISSRLEPS